jgi:putative transposase
MNGILKHATHTPAHFFRANAVYIVTAATYHHWLALASDARKTQWLGAFQTAARINGWTIIAWVVLANHYHVIIRAPEASAENLPRFVSSCHKFTARQWNQEDGQVGRQVWWNYWDTCVRSEQDYLARLVYVLWNPVKHGLTDRPEQYRFSSYYELFGDQPEEWKRLEHDYGAAKMKLGDVPDDF